jgi:hypothetical protein
MFENVSECLGMFKCSGVFRNVVLRSFRNAWQCLSVKNIWECLDVFKVHECLNCLSNASERLRMLRNVGVFKNASERLRMSGSV